VQLGLENKKQTMWAAVLGVVAVVVLAYEVIPMFMGSSTQASSAEITAPVAAEHAPSRSGTKNGKKVRVENLDPTLRLDLLAASEQTQYEGTGRNIFVPQADVVEIPKPIRTGAAGPGKNGEDPLTGGPLYHLPANQPPPPIPLKFYGFATSTGEAKKIFLKSGEDVFVAGEGEIVDRRYKVIRITPTSVSIQDMVYSGPPQNIPLTQG
jgi:hypothetical protein